MQCFMHGACTLWVHGYQQLACLSSYPLLPAYIAYICNTYQLASAHAYQLESIMIVA